LVPAVFIQLFTITARTGFPFGASETLEQRQLPLRLLLVLEQFPTILPFSLAMTQGLQPTRLILTAPRALQPNANIIATAGSLGIIQLALAT
jgi:hypothetical protein